jgi:NADH dehydrogenase
MNPKRFAVTGAFGYSGKYITRGLLEAGHEVITLTGNPNRPSPFCAEVKAYPFNFEAPEKLVQTLQGVDVLINTYWVRFDYGGTTYQSAVANSRVLFQAAKDAGVRRLVHVSITNPDERSPLPYFSGKFELEKSIRDTGLSYAILRPTVIFGKEDILINNIAWFLRYFPFFPIPGDGEYQLQPIYVTDLAKLVVEMAGKDENVVIDAIGPETFSFNQLVSLLKSTVRSWSIPLHVSPGLSFFLSGIIGKFVGDVVLTREEVLGLMDNLLVTDSPPAGETRLSDWVRENKATLGKRYANELTRHFKGA